jgi:hypothetical protein
MAQAVATSPSASSRALGVAGILGGAALLAAFVVEIAPDVNNVRLVVFNIGAIAVVLAVHRGQVAAAPTLAATVAGAALLANAWYLAMVILATGRLQPFAGDFGLVFFVAGAAMWLTDAAFGLVALRLGVVARWGALALAIGSVLALTGMDRLELSPRDNPTIFGPLGLAGVALNGIGWILLGVDVATRGDRGKRQLGPASGVARPNPSVPSGRS